MGGAWVLLPRAGILLRTHRAPLSPAKSRSPAGSGGTKGAPPRGARFSEVEKPLGEELEKTQSMLSFVCGLCSRKAQQVWKPHTDICACESLGGANALR